MVSPKSHLFKGVILLLLLFLAMESIQAQCNPPDQLPSIDCQGAPLVCLQDACYETLNNPLFCCNGWCGANTAVHNPEYFQFIPTQPDVEIHIFVNDCSSGNGLQSALLDACPWDNSNVISCDPGTPPGGTMVLVATGLVVGQVYWLIIDGSGGATCDYTITYTEGIFEPGLDSELASGEAVPSSVCVGFDEVLLTADPPVGNAHGYYWVLEWSGDTITSTLPETTIDIPTNVPPGTYDICVRAFSGCDTSDIEICFPLEIYEIPEEEKDPESFCPEVFPFYWGNVSINGPGDYAQTFTTPEGCTFDSTWMVEEYPEVPVGYLDTLHCEETLIYEGEAYDQAGIYDLFYPGMGLNGCDSTAELDVTLAALTAYIELACENGEFVLSVTIEDLLPTNADLEYEWYDGPSLVSTDIMYNTLFGGVYTCIVSVITDAGECRFPLEPFAFDEADLRPDPPNMGFTDTLVCAQSGIFFEVIVDPFEDPYTYTWSSPANVPNYQDGSAIAEFDFSNAGPSEICVYATNDCGDGPETCFMVDITPTPVASFIVDTDLCVDSTTVVTFTGTASAIAEIIWDFDNPTTITGTGVGPYAISWAVPGDKVINLTVIEPGCDTAFYSTTVSVTNLIPPVINCSSTINSVTFDWDDVAGSNGYLVSIDGGAPVPTATSTWMVGSLTPGTVVNLTLTVVSAGACADLVLMASCTAEDCPPPTIILSGQDSACLNNPTIIDLDALVNGLPGVGTWAGPGIVDAAQGLFDPKVAAAGQHQVTFTTDVNGCPFTRPYVITVFDSLTADFVLDPIICITDLAGLTFTGNASAGATFDFDFGAATVVSGSGPGPYQLSWASPGNKTVRLQVSENGCTSDIISHTTDVSATLNAPVINCSPNTSGILFSWTTDPAAAAYVVNTILGSGGIPIGTDSLSFTGLVPGDQVQIEIVTVSAGPCPDRRDSLLCIARDCPMPVIAITPVNDICLYPGTGIVDLQVSVTNGAGTGVWAGTGVTDVVNGTFDPVLAGAGSHLITYNYNDDGCDFIESITINVYDVPGAFISNTDLMITCTSSSIFLDGSSSSGAPLNYQWSSMDGVISSGATTAIAEASAPGTYKLVVTNSISGCKDSTSVVVTQDSNIPTADAGPDKTLTCDSLSFALGGMSTTGVNVIYTWTTTGGNIIGATNGQHIVADMVGQYDIIVRDTATGCQSTDRALIGIDTAVATMMLTAGDTIDCNTTTSTAQAALGGPVQDYNLQWSTTDGSIVGSTNGTDITVSQGGTYTLTITSKINGCQDAQSVFVPESDEIIDALDVRQTNVVCHGEDNGTIMVQSVDGGAPPYTYQWSGTTQTGTVLTDLPPGLYAVTVTDQNGCTIAGSYQITEPELVTINVGPDMTVRILDSVIISMITNVSQGAVSSIEWTNSDNSLNCSNCTELRFVASTSTTINAMIIDTSGCDATDSMRLTVLVPRIYYIPNVFSPNGDGINDYFSIWGRFNLVNIPWLRVFDRWGNQLFENLNFQPNVESEGWDGRFKGEPMLPGVYVYSAKLEFEDGKSEVVTGEVTIIR